MRRSSGIALLLALTTSCAQKPAEPTAPPPVPSAPVPEALPPPESGPFAKELAEVAKARGLAAKHAVAGRHVSREEMMREVDGELEREVPPSVVTGLTAALIALGLAPRDFDYLTAVRILMGEKLAGFYQPRTKTMFIAQDLPENEQTATLHHELVHALQDQHFNLGPRVAYREGAGDEQAALHALAEGEAMHVMVDLMLAPHNKSALDLTEEQLAAMEADQTMDGDVPQILVRSLLSPYFDGQRFVSALRRRGGWDAVTKAWSAPPMSSEQLLHIAKYDAKEPPIQVAAPPPPAAEYRREFRDVLGEQGLRAVLQEWHSGPVGAALASGWGGDQLAVYVSSGKRAVAWLIVMDTEALAGRLEKGLVPGLVPAAVAPAADGSRCVESPQGPTALLRDGRRLMVTVLPDGTCTTARSWAAAAVAAAPR